MVDKISPEAIMALAVLNATESKTAILIEDVSRLFFDIREKGLDLVEPVALRRVPGGFYSEDVEAFFGQLIAGGYAEARSPMTIKADGEQICRRIIEGEKQAHEASLKAVAAAIGLSIV